MVDLVASGVLLRFPMMWLAMKRGTRTSSDRECRGRMLRFHKTRRYV